MQFGFETTGDEIASFHGAAQGKTGATGAIGGATARAFVMAGAATIILVGRDLAKLDALADTLRAPLVTVITVAADLASLASVRSAAVAVLSDSRIHMLDYVINNAAIMASPFSLTVDGIEAQFGVNHIAHFLLTNLLRPKFASDVVVVNVASNAYQLGDPDFADVNFEKKEYFELGAYGNGKMGNVLFTRALVRRGVRSLTLHPGFIPSNLQQHLTPELLSKTFGIMASHLPPGAELPKRENPKTPAQGCATTLRAALDGSLPNGVYLENCNEVELKVQDADEKAEALWKLSEGLVGQTFS